MFLSMKFIQLTVEYLLFDNLLSTVVFILNVHSQL